MDFETLRDTPSVGGHVDGLAGPVRHLGASPLERAAVGGDIEPYPIGRRRFGEPDKRCRRIELAEEERRVSNSTASLQYSSRRFVTSVTPG